MNSQEDSVEILLQLKQVFKEAMGDHVSIDYTATRDQLADWNSMNHLNLVVELENVFNLKLSMEEIENLKSVRKIVDRILISKSQKSSI